MGETLYAIAKTDNQGRLGYYHLPQVQDFLKQHPNQNVVIHMSVQGGDKLVAFYRNFILPRMRDAFFAQGSVYKVEEIHEMMLQELPSVVLRSYGVIVIVTGKLIPVQKMHPSSVAE